MKLDRRVLNTRNPVLRGLHAITRKQIVPDKRRKLKRELVKRDMGSRELACRA